MGGRLLHYTSLGFGAVAVAGQGTWLCPALVALMALSLLNHGRAAQAYWEKEAVRRADTLVAHGVYAGAVAHAVVAATAGASRLALAGYWLNAAYTIVVWTAGLCHHPRWGDGFHASLHASGTLGLLALTMA